MTHDEAQQHLALLQATDGHIEQRLNAAVDRQWRAADQALNGTIRSFLREVAVLRQLPFPQSEPGRDG